MGAAGDMLLSALVELTDDPDAFIDRLNSLGIPGAEYIKASAVKCGITGTHIDVRIETREHHHHHSSLRDMEEVIEKLPVSGKTRDKAISAFRLIAEAESSVHGRAVEEIHFHEVGTADAVADVVGVCLAMEEIGAEKIAASRVHVGSGTVKCAHGILPVPAPATAYILRGIPIYGGRIDGELCTPTGAALLKTFVSDFGDMPAMRVTKIGCGMGTKDFEAANCLRAMLGESEGGAEEIVELACNIDDMTAEEIGFAVEMLSEGGARDVYTAPIYMKKNRPGTLLNVICGKEDKEKLLSLIFNHTSTIGVREYVCGRYTLRREELTKDTPYGKIRVKRSFGYGTEKEKPEYEDIARIAKDKDISIAEVKKNL